MKRRLLLIAVLTLAKIPLLSSQSFADREDLRLHLFKTALTTSTDQLFDSTSIRLRLLPQKLGVLESGLWGESGWFRTTGIASPLTPDGRMHELGVRRAMLSAHQIGGFTTLGLMIASSYYGQRVLDGDINSSDMHSTLVKWTIASYSATALLSVLSPPPLIRRNEESTITIHKTLAWVHFAGMVLTPVLGKMIWKFEGPNPKGPTVNKSAERFHQIAGYVTTAAFASAMVVVTF